MGPIYRLFIRKKDLDDYNRQSRLEETCQRQKFKEIQLKRKGNNALDYLVLVVPSEVLGLDPKGSSITIEKKNTWFYHKLANERRKKNHMVEVKDRGVT